MLYLCRVELSSLLRGSRHVQINADFFTGYRQNIVQPDELLVCLNIPCTSPDQYFVAYKQAKRRHDDIAIVNMAMNVSFEPNTDVVASFSVAFGGMAPTVVLASNSCAKIIGNRWIHQTIETFSDSLIKELPLDPSAPGGMVLYRRTLTLSLVFKAYLEISQSLEKYITNRQVISARERSGKNQLNSLNLQSSQAFEKFPGSNLQIHALRQPRVQSSAFKQATGEAVYIDDMPKLDNELYLALVLSTIAHGTIASIDASEALRHPGVHAFFSSKDLNPEQNSFGPVIQDEEIFVSSKVTSRGQVLGAIVADNQSTAQEAARLVCVKYKDILPIIVTIEDAIAADSFFEGCPKQIESGDITAAFKASDVIVNGSCRMGGQEHFYLETHVALAVPRDVDEMEIFSSSQHIAWIQKGAAHMLGIPISRVVTRAKRIGGGFGGKESRSFMVALPVALAAQRLNRPVRCMLDRNVDMSISGSRHPYYFKYKAGATRDGKLTAFELDVYSNGGCTRDFSFEVS